MWYELWKARMQKVHNIKLEEQETQQLSKHRAAINLSDLRAFQSTVNSLLDDHPEVKSRGLNATADWDESKLDLNALVQGAGLVPDGQLAQWEVEGERSPQITMLGGFAGFRREDSDLPRSLKEIRTLIAKAKGGELDDELACELCKIGTIAGYPKLEPGVWDSEDFCVLPQLLIFEGKTSADPAWLNEAHDRTRTMVATTESGFINTALKYEWYRKCKELPHCPFGKKPTIPQADSHASNESVEMSAEMELEDEAYLIAPPGHSTHLTQQLDQTGGPIQHYKRICLALLRNSYRTTGKFSKQRIVRCCELAYVLSFTPAVCSHATRYVGWEEDANGGLIYSPLSRAHIMVRLHDDEGSQPVSTVASSSTTREGKLAAFRAGAMRGDAGLKAGQKAALEIFGRGEGSEDGFSDVGETEAIAEEGSRTRRNALPRGRIVASAEFREGREGQDRSLASKAEAARIKCFQERRTAIKLLDINARAEAKLGRLTAREASMTNEERTAYIRVRTNEPLKLPSTLKGDELKETLFAKMEEVRIEDPKIILGLEPPGFAVWLAAEEEKKKAKKAPEGPLLLLAPTDTPSPPALALPPPPLLEPMEEERPLAQTRARRSCAPSAAPEGTPPPSPNAKAAKLLHEITGKASPNTRAALAALLAQRE